jgi:hypothetical protein
VNDDDLVGSGRGLILRHSSIPLEGSRKPRKISVRIVGRWGRDLNLGPPEYEEGVLTTRHDVRLKSM